MSFFAGMMLALSLDDIFSFGLKYAISDILRMRISSIRGPCMSLAAHSTNTFDGDSHCHIASMVAVWIFFSVLVFFVQANFSGLYQKWRPPTLSQSARNILLSGPGYKPVPTSDRKVLFSQNNAAKDNAVHFRSVKTKHFNFFDWKDLPPEMESLGSQILAVQDQLSDSLGFQTDNIRNQSEHLLMLITNAYNPSDGSYAGPVERLHMRMFLNYRNWVKRMETESLIVPNKLAGENGTSGTKNYLATSNRTVLYIRDILLFLYVWGEAANLRHLPECLCFLYHKSLEVVLAGQSSNKTKEVEIGKPPGFFLESVIIPLYNVVSSGLRKGKDHFEKKTYDDFNEFFWNPSCLSFSLFTAEDLDDQIDTIAMGLEKSKKTYLEKRSWLHPLLSMHRVLEWHIVTFSILATLSFAVQLQWNLDFSLQVGSCVFWIITLLSIVWTCLEIWTLYPDTNISISSVCGYLLRLSAGYLVLIYLTIYYHWSFREPAQPNSGMRSQGSPMFWWWQYVWLSVISLAFYFLESILCWVPSIVSFFMTWNFDIFQSLLNICYPFSQLFIGKETHVRQSKVFWYIFFWITLLGFKLWFGYHFIVYPVVVPTLELYDDYMNFGKTSFFKTSILIVVWWFPHFVVYLIDLSIWYSVWASLAGGFVALIERQGAVRDFRTLRSHFIRAPLAFCQKIMPENSIINQKSSGIAASTVVLDQLVPPEHHDSHHSHFQQNISYPTFNSKAPVRSASSADFMTLQGNSSSGNDNGKKETSNPDTKSTQQSLNEFLDVRSQRWIIFGRVWNDIIKHLRDTDHISNSEKDILSFTTFEWLTKPVYLPLFISAGCVENSAILFRDTLSEYLNEPDPEKKLLIIENFHEGCDTSMSESMHEALELLVWISSTLLGSTHTQDFEFVAENFSTWGKNDEIFSRLNGDQIFNLLNVASSFISSLKGGFSKRSNKPLLSEEEIQKLNFESSKNKSNSSTAMKRSMSTGFLVNMGEENGDKVKKSAAVPVSPVIHDPYRDKIREECRNFLNSLCNILRGTSMATSPASLGTIDRLNFIMKFEHGFFWSDVYATQRVDDFASDPNTLRALNKLNGLLRLRQTDTEPASKEARRRLYFFINSLFMDLPVAPSIKYSKEYTCMTPFYSEDVLLTKDDLESRNSDGVSTLLYLQTLYKRDWLNFLERRAISDESLIWSKDHQQSIRMWASLRAQTLFRTVDGMMYTEAAIRLLSELENIHATDAENLCKLKFNYVVACQVYGQMKRNVEHKAEDIEFLLSRHPNLRVAYIDSMRANREGEMHFFSVLIKYSKDDDSLSPTLTSTTSNSPIKEVYRVRLPGNPVLGEGKPENQNHAIVFSRGRYLQAIDMNQDGYFEESIKMRNLLQEFDNGCSIVGFREHIFTGSVSSVANYMALQELSFVTLGQRVLSNPLCIRQHYGHPDFFDKLFVMTEGGMSKASKGINLSEDVFAGFNATIRGKTVGFQEYAQVGKGRDVGLQQTYKFEAKLSQGNAEQSISRDMNRICDRLDFFRLLSFYYGGVGHYMSNTMVMFALVIVVYAMLCLSIFNEEGVNGRPIQPEGVLQMLLAGLGVVQTMPLAVTLTVEKGFINALGEILYMMLSGGPLYFIFHIQTKCFYFQQTLLAGNAIYRPTGRGFVIRHSPFDENFRFFAVSHIYLGFELMVALLLLAIYTGGKQYGGLTWSLWMTVISFLLGPFWFNPITFELAKVQEDYLQWIKWMTEVGGTAEQSWHSWWKEENSFYKNLSFSWKLWLCIQKCCLWTFISVGLFGSSFFHHPEKQYQLAEVVGLYALFFIIQYCLALLEKSLSYAIRRFLSLLLSAVVIGVTIFLFISNTVYIRYTLSLYYLASSFSFLALICGSKNVATIYKFHDYLVGHVIFVILLFLSLLQLGYIQTYLLYHNALSSGVVIEDILKYARKSKEKALDEKNSIADLKRQVENQAKEIELMMNFATSTLAEQQHNHHHASRPVNSSTSLLFSRPQGDYGSSSTSAGGSKFVGRPLPSSNTTPVHISWDQSDLSKLTVHLPDTK